MSPFESDYVPPGDVRVEVRRLRALHYSVALIALKLNLPEATIFRILRPEVVP